MIGAATSLTIMAVLVRFLTPQIPVEEQIFLRNIITLCLTLPWMLRSGVTAFRTSRFGGHALRNGFLYTGNVAWFYGVTLVPLADLSALQFTMPLFTVLLAAVFLRERMGSHRWIATAIGFTGALVIIQPGASAIQLGSFVVLAAAFLYSCSYIVTKHLSDTESGTVVVFYMSITITVYSLVPRDVRVGDSVLERFARLDRAGCYRVFDALLPHPRDGVGRRQFRGSLRFPAPADVGGAWLCPLHRTA